MASPPPSDPGAALWDAYNLLLAGPDLERLRKLLCRYELFRRTIELPGDVVEAGVLKGTGLMLWMKLLAIHCPGSAKRVVGFDFFEGLDQTFAAKGEGAEAARDFLVETSFSGITPAQILDMVRAANLDPGCCELVAGDLTVTAARYALDNPGFRISLLNVDVDLAEPAEAVLEALWPRVVPGGIVLLDEYGIGRWTESEGVDRFLARTGVQPRTLPWARSPTAYLVKG